MYITRLKREKIKSVSPCIAHPISYISRRIAHVVFSISPRIAHVILFLFFQVLFLPKREHHRETANLLTGESGGLVRAWSTCSGELLGQFMATRDHRESVTALTTDENNTIFISGDTVGYVRVSDGKWKKSK